MNPILLDFGVFQISWYSIFILVAIFIGGTLCLLEAKKHNMDSNFITNLVFWLALFGIIGARLYYVAFNWSYYSSNWIDVFRVWEGGLAIHGAIIADVIYIIIYSLKYKIKPLLLIDIVIPSVIIGQAIGRWGNFFNQEAHGGEVTRSFLEKLHIPNFIIEGMRIYGTYYQPTFLYESLWCILGFVFLIIIRQYKYLKIGQLTGIYFMWYGLGRFFIEMLRTDSLMLGSFRVAQIVSIVLFLAGIMLVSVNSFGSKFENLYKEGGKKNEIRF